MDGWSEKRGRVSRAFGEWKLIDQDQRTFLRLGLDFAKAQYDRLWAEAGEEPYWDGGPEQLDSFEDKIDALWEDAFSWMHVSGVLRDAVSNFEIYLEKAREEVLASQGRPIPIDNESPRWGAQRKFFGQLGIDIETGPVKDARDLRNFLTHRRGELRTEELRRRFQATHSDLMPPWVIELGKERVVEAMDNLASAVREIDPTVYKFGRGRVVFSHLDP